MVRLVLGNSSLRNSSMQVCALIHCLRQSWPDSLDPNCVPRICKFSVHKTSSDCWCRIRKFYTRWNRLRKRFRKIRRNEWRWQRLQNIFHISVPSTSPWYTISRSTMSLENLPPTATVAFRADNQNVNTSKMSAGTPVAYIFSATSANWPCQILPKHQNNRQRFWAFYKIMKSKSSQSEPMRLEPFAQEYMQTCCIQKLRWQLLEEHNVAKICSATLFNCDDK